MRKEIICKTCFWCGTHRKESWCKIIENEGGGSCSADRIECELYLKKGTEPQMPCAMCGKNTYGESSIGTSGKWYHDSCHWKFQEQEKDWQLQLHKAQKKHNWSDKEMATIYHIVGLVQADTKEKIREKIKEV